MTIHFLVNNQTIKRTDENVVVAGSRNYLYAEFALSEEWTGTVTAVFKNGDAVYNQILDENNRCLVPWEVLTFGTVEVSCFCGDRITADSATVNIERSGYELGEESVTPSPDVYSQLIEKIDKANGAHNYSTQEQVVGKWLNGKTLYERSYEIRIPRDEELVSEIDCTDIENVISMEGFVRSTDTNEPENTEDFLFSGSFDFDNEHLVFSFYSPKNPDGEIPKGIYCYSSGLYYNAYCVVTVRYTKKEALSDDE